MKTTTTEKYTLGKYHLENSMERMMDLVCCGLESGTYGSFCIVKYVKPEKIEFTIDTIGGNTNYADCAVYKHIDYPFNHGGAVIFKIKDDYCDSEEDDKQRFTLDREALMRGMQILMEKYPRIYGDWIKDNEDALTGDAFIQCCLLGEVVYG